IHSPADIKNKNLDQLKEIADEMRSALITKLSAHGGHVGPNLGMVEAIIALHYVFDAPKDKLVFDVSHQSYSHKMLTGRMEAFIDPAHYDDVTGYTQPRESEYDLFSVGHTSTSISMATGLAKARDLRGGDENVIAVIGDASLGGGMAFEGLDYGATLGTNLIVVVNDNDMSIAHNHGGLYADLRLLRNTNGTADNNYFRSIGYSYRYVQYGNDLASLIKTFSEVKDYQHPVVVHINTMKGMGLPVAERDKETFHFSAPFNAETGAPLKEYAEGQEPEDYSDIFATRMLAKMKENPLLAILTAGTPAVLGFNPERRKEAGRQFIDVGICEQQAVAMAGALCKGGAKGVFGVVSTFLQRAYDQFSHDVALNRLPAVFPVFYGGLFGMNDETHLGFFDIALLSNIPNFTYLAPTCKEEFIAMLDWAISQNNGPVGIRIPVAPVTSDSEIEILNDYSRPSWQVVRQGSRIALIGAGAFYSRAAKAADLLAENGIEVTLINPRSYTYLDTVVLDTLKEYDRVITLEDGIIDGGFGQKVAAYLSQSPVKVTCLGLPREYLNE
ncbi:MAG: 1-deoxy-D-xylulose-5-phosphate synthase, partial [Duncaniella sp.]|nr:1-deoxy-D-xylulose-5-phosphate synthase [Duncaniella sp.]